MSNCLRVVATRYDKVRVPYRDFALGWLRKELYWAIVAGVNWHDRYVSYEFLRKAIAGLYEFYIRPEAIRSSREAR